LTVPADHIVSATGVLHHTMFFHFVHCTRTDQILAHVIVVVLDGCSKTKKHLVLDRWWWWFHIFPSGGIGYF
jgi:hypothetical protein